MFGSVRKSAAGTPARVYKEIRAAFDSENLVYREDTINREICCLFEGDDMPVKLSVSVSDEAPVIMFDCLLDFKAPSQSFGTILEGLNVINSALHFGAFILDPESGRLLYRYHFLMDGHIPSKDVILGVVKMVVDTVDANDGGIKALIPEMTTFADPMFG
ncbi:MAG: YbjN domain-containing protein [Methanomethylophilus sp.]|nr:YbjN domain-containing protein [Methanomethylophilus sp.]